MFLTKHPSDFGGFEAHEVWQLLDDDLTCDLGGVNALDAPPLPVAPVDVITQQREAEYMGQFIIQQSHSVRPVHVYHLNKHQRDSNHLHEASLLQIHQESVNLSVMAEIHLFMV